MSQVDAALVARMAWLARVHLTQEEAQQLQHDLGNILSYVEALRSVDTTGVLPMLHAGEHATPLRADTPVAGLGEGQALANAPTAADGCFTVPRMVSQGA